MSDPKQTHRIPLIRRQKNSTNRFFGLVFVERVYDGPPRWWSDKWQKHHNTPAGATGDRLDREERVKKSLRMAHNPHGSVNQEVCYLITCTNFKCPFRPWTSVCFNNASRSIVKSETDLHLDEELFPKEREQLRARIKQGLARTANGLTLTDQCPNCPSRHMLFPIVPLMDKWVYVLRGSDDMTPHAEIYMQDPSSGRMYRELRNGAFNPDKSQPFEGYFPIDKIDNVIWEFFLSPVRLGPKALDLLSQSRSLSLHTKESPVVAPARQGVMVNPMEQPWSTTVDRIFSEEQAKTPFEYIPLVDPFAWVGQIADLDYLPIIAARQQLIQDPGEQAKAFIAATLSPNSGEEQDKANLEKSDPWSLKTETVEPPPEFASSGNIAKAWIQRYDDALEYLEDEVRTACYRVTFPIRACLSHRIVELACQENTKDPAFLSYGMVHWAHILRDMLVCQAGQGFIRWLAADKEAGERIPRKNVLRTAQHQKDGSYKIEPGLPGQILGYFVPVLIGRKGGEGEVRGYLHEIEVEIPIDWMKVMLAPETTHAIADVAFHIPIEHLEHYYRHFPKEIKVEQFHSVNGASGWLERIKGIGSLKDLLRVAALFHCFQEFADEDKDPTTGWDHFTQAGEKVETWVKISEFVVEQGSLLVKEGLANNLNEVEKKILQRLAHQVYLGPYANKLLKASKSIRALRMLGVGGKILGGPVSLAMGGFEIVAQAHEGQQALDAGDTKAAGAHAVKAFAGAMVTVVSGVETLALAGQLAGSEALMELGALSWLGPVGWISAGVMVLGEVFLAYGKKTDYELFASHCFLGKEAAGGGKDPTNYPWMGKMGWERLQEPVAGRAALLRLVSGFSVWIGWYPRSPSEGPWWQIKANYIPAGAYFEVEIDFHKWGDPEENKMTRKAKIFPEKGGELKMEDGNSTDCDVRSRRYPDATVIDVKIVANWPDVHYDWGVRVRLNYDGVNTHPADGWVKNEHGSVSSMKSTSGPE